MPRLALAALGILLTCLPAPAQDPAADAARLQRLLQELGKLDPKAWAQRKAALEQAARAEEERAQQHRAEAAKVVAQAEAADAEAKRLRGEIAQLQQLEPMLRALQPATLVAPVPAAPPAPPATPPASPATPASPAAPKVAAAEPATAAADPSPRYVDWAAVEPLLQDRCSACHEPNEKKGGLDVTTFAALRQGGGSGRTLVPGEPEQSRLWLMVTQQERPFMPKGEEPLAAEPLALLRTWIEQGACETVAAARAFVAARMAAARAPAGAAAAAAAGPVPSGLPSLPLQLPARPGAVKALARSPNAPVLALPGLQQVLLFDPQLHALGVLPIEAVTVEQLGFAADGTQLVAAVGEPGRRGSATVFDVATGKALGTFGSERDVPLAVAVHAASGLVALGGSGKRVQVLRQRDGSEAASGAHDDFVLTLQFSPDGTLLAAGDRAGEVRLWETSGGGLVETLTGHRGAVHALAFAGNGARLYTAGADGTVRGFDPASGKELWRQQAHDGQALAIATGPDGSVASCGSDGRIQVFDAAGKVLGKSPAAGDWLYAVAFGADGKSVWAGDWQGRLHHFVVGGKQKTMDVVTPLARPR